MKKLAASLLFMGLAWTVTGCPKTIHNPSGSPGGSAGAGSAGSGQQAGQGGTAGTGSGHTSDGGVLTKPDAGSGSAGTGMHGDAGSMPAADGGTGTGGAVSCSPACASYQHCELVQVTCVRAPCPPLPECVDNATCGGIAGKQCPGNGKCQDDPRDSCDPAHGGADCGGLCTCVQTVLCVKTKIFDTTSCSCIDDPCATARCMKGTHCVASGKQAVCQPDPGSGGGGSCGKNTCLKGEFCCNASCGTCAPMGGACTQIACM